MSELDELEKLAGAIELIAERVHYTARQKGWWQCERNDGELIALMHSELSEALEELRKGEMCDDEHLAEELADCIIRILDYGYARGLAIGHAVVTKMAANAERSYHHGGKAF